MPFNLAKSTVVPYILTAVTVSAVGITVKHLYSKCMGLMTKEDEFKQHLEDEEDLLPPYPGEELNQSSSSQNEINRSISHLQENEDLIRINNPLLIARYKKIMKDKVELDEEEVELGIKEVEAILALEELELEKKRQELRLRRRKLEDMVKDLKDQKRQD